jgi:hypothetical protein
MQQKLFQLSGIVFVALVLVAIIGLGGGTPGPDTSVEKLASFYSGNDVRQFITSFVLAAAAPFPSSSASHSSTPGGGSTPARSRRGDSFCSRARSWPLDSAREFLASQRVPPA